jgi:hypothetical protein
MLDSINVDGASLDECKEMQDTLHKYIWQLDQTINHYELLAQSNRKTIDLQSTEIAELNNQGVMYQKQAKKDQRKIKFLKVQRNGLALAVGVALVKIFILH